MTDPITRLNAALEGRYRVERYLADLSLSDYSEPRFARSMTLYPSTYVK